MKHIIYYDDNEIALCKMYEIWNVVGRMVS